MLSKSVLLACLLFSSNSVVKGQININSTTLTPNATAIISNNNNSTQQQPQMNCTVQDEELPELQSGLNNFVIDMLDTFPFPFAFGQCTSASLLPSNKRYIYKCNMDSSTGISTVIKTEYNDATCSGSGLVVEQFSETNATGAKGYFDCSGYDTFVEIEFSFNSTCQNPVTVYGALGSCSNFMNSSSNSLQMNLYCNEEEAVMQIFNLMNSLDMTSTFAPFNETLPSLLNETTGTLPSLFNATTGTLPSLLNETTGLPSTSNQPDLMMMCTDDTFCDKWTISNQCKKITSFPLVNNQTLYGRMMGCVVDIAMSTTQMMSTTDLNISVTESTDVTIGATGGEISTTPILSSSTTTTIISTTTTSGAIRPSFLFASILLLLFSLFM